jgi:hypothetical protein
MLQTNNKDLWTSKPVFCASKKKVANAYTPNSYRIFQDEISDKRANIPIRAQTADANIAATGMNFKTRKACSYWNKQTADLTDFRSKPGFILNHPKEPTRRNCPHPSSAKFLRSNVAMLNDAIPRITTDTVVDDQRKWWEHTSHNKNFVDNDNCTAGRSTFKTRSQPLVVIKSDQTNTKNPYNLPKIIRKKQPATSDWILRHNTCDDKKFIEHISYRHGYNRRFYKHEPIRGKLPGNFVWQEKVKN